MNEGTQHDHDRAFGRVIDDNLVMERLEELAEKEFRSNSREFNEWVREYCDTRQLALLAALSYDIDPHEFTRCRDQLLHDYTQYRAGIAQNSIEWEEIAEMVDA